MDFSVTKKRSAMVLGGLLTLTIGAGSMQASVLSASATATAALTATTVTCNTLTGPPNTGVNVTIHAYPAPTGTHTWTVGFTPIAGIKVTPPANVVLSSANNTAGIVFTINSLPGCAGLSTSSAGVNSISLQLTSQADVGLSTQQPAGNDVTVAVTDTLTATASPLVASNVTITCAYTAASGPNPAVYVPGSPQLVGVTSAANGGTPFTVTTAGAPAWLGFGPAAPSGTAGTTSTYFTLFANPGCGADGPSGDQTYSLPIAISPGPAVNITVTLHFTTKSPLTVTPSSISLSYVKGSGVAAVANVNVTSSVASAYFTVNTSTLPIWLTVSTTGATVPVAGKAMSFTTTTAADNLAPGTYTATVFLQVSGSGDYPVSVTALITNKPAKLVITSANPMAVTYNLGGATPVTTITVASTDSPIPFSITTAGVLAPQLTAGEQSTGIAYSFGSQVSFTYNPALFQTSAPGTVVTGTVTFTWGSPASSTVVTINLTVASPAATVTSLSPATLPTAASGTTFYVTLTGSGFVGGSDPTLATRVGVVTGAMPGTLNTDTNITVSAVTNPSNLTVKIVVPTVADANLPFTVGGAGGPVYLGVVNGNSSSIPTGYATLNIGSTPIIYGVTSASSFTEVSGGNLPTLAPYDMISIFGANFCSAGNVSTNCGTTTILPGAPDPVTYRFPFTLTPDGAAPASGNDTRRQLSVTIYPHGQTTGGLAAPLLFATNSQINAILPGAVSTSTEYYDVVVNFGCPLLVGSVGCATSTVASSPAFEVNIVPTDPGIFTVGSDGQGQAAALASGTYALITSANPAGMRNGAASDTIQVFVTGLGTPSTGAAYTSNSGACISALGTGYLGALTATYPALSGLTNIDGFVLQDSLFPGDLPPCFTTEPTATVGGVPATINYAAFVGDTVAGLYQLNLVLPSTQHTFQPNYPSATGQFTNLTAPTQLPLFVTAGGVTTQTGVMLPVAPMLLMAHTPAYSSGTTYNLSIGHAFTSTITGSNNGVSTGVTYALTSGVLPKGLTLTQAANVATIAGTPAQGTAGTYPVTVTATDSSAVPITGSISYTFYVPGGLFVTASAPTLSTFGTANNAIATVTAVGGTPPYNQFAITSTAITGLTVTTGGVVQTDGTTPAGIYNITVTATDANGITGTVTLTITVDVELTYTAPVTVTAADTSTTITTVTAHGGAGPYTYSLDPSNSANALLLTINPATGVITNNGAADTTPTMPVIIDVIDTGAAQTGATSVAPGTVTITVTITG